MGDRGGRRERGEDEKRLRGERRQKRRERIEERLERGGRRGGGDRRE